MNEWLEEFYASEEMTEGLRRSFVPLFAAYARTLVDEPDEAFVAGLAAAFIQHYLDSSRAQLQEVLAGADDPVAALTQRMDEWVEKRPGKVAMNETIRAANAVRLDAMRREGVTRKVWASSGGSCPFCSGLDGTTVEIERDFFTPDDTYQPEGADEPLTFSSSIGHPPIHQGCDCSIVAG